MSRPVGEIRYRGKATVRPYRRGTYLGGDYLEELIERAIGDRYAFGQGWEGVAEVSIVFYDSAEAQADGARGAARGAPPQSSTNVILRSTRKPTT